MALRILDPGLQTLLVDHGRPYTRGLGVPVGGAADRQALSLGNALVGNPPGVAALEVCLLGPTLRAEEQIGCVVYGAPFTVTGDRHARPGALEAGKTFTLLPGETLRIGGTPAGARAYFCVRGGLRGPAILGSQSALQPLSAGAVIACQPSAIAPRFLRLDDEPAATEPLRVLPGPQADWFEPDSFFRQAFAVTPASNRMGLRLEGEPLPAREPGTFREMVSEPVAPGAVQVTRDGQCIVLGVDGQTIGGYPKIAHVVAADLDRLGQLRPGQVVRFTRVGMDEAERLFRARQTRLREWTTRLLITNSSL